MHLIINIMIQGTSGNHKIISLKYSTAIGLQIVNEVTKYYSLSSYPQSAFNVCHQQLPTHVHCPVCYLQHSSCAHCSAQQDQ